MTRLLVVGLDGGTDAVIGLPDANLPNIAAVRGEGASATLRSTVPPITAAAWPSMMTGWNPGRHGMYDFRTLGIEKYSRLWGAGHSASFEDGRDFVTSRRWSGAAFWDQLEGSVAVLSVPMTYPAWQVHGVMVSGFPLPDYGRNHSQPPQAGDQLPTLLDFADRIGKLSDSELADACLRLIAQQREIVMRWLRDGDHEAVVVVFQSTDFAQHRLWKYLDQPGASAARGAARRCTGRSTRWWARRGRCWAPTPPSPSSRITASGRTRARSYAPTRCWPAPGCCRPARAGAPASG